MIIDRIENAALYNGLGAGIVAALNYIKQNDLNNVEVGKYEIVKDQVVMLVMESVQKNTNKVRMEAHRKNIDVQYWVKGSELMGYDSLQSQEVLDPFNEEKDYGIYAGEGYFTRFVPGMFAIYFPTDLHTAIADENCPTRVKKIVFKVGVE